LTQGPVFPALAFQALLTASTSDGFAWLRERVREKSDMNSDTPTFTPMR
jgi:hypothetical protein